MSSFLVSLPQASRRTLAPVLAAAALAASMPAAALTFAFTGQGTVSAAPTAVPTIIQLAVADTAYQFPVPGVVSLASVLEFDVVAQTGAGLFQFSQGANSIFGSLSSLALPVAAGPGFALQYSVLGGTGEWSGFTGSGSSVVRLVGDVGGTPPFPYLEAGILSLVPEPAMWALMLLGVTGLIAARSRDRGE